MLVRLEAFYFLRKGNFVQKILHQTEGAKPAADEAAHKGADKEEKSHHVKGKFIVHISYDGLQGADGACPLGTGAGIAIHPRYAEVFHFALIYFARLKSFQVGIGGEKPQALKKVALRFFHGFFFTSQCRYTPCKFLWPCSEPPASLPD